MSEGESDSPGGIAEGESFVDFKCPYCGEGISFPEPRKGLLEECPMCMESVVVPNDGSEVGGRVPFPITSERLVLRRFEREDWEGATEMFNDPGHRDNQGEPYEEEEIIAFIERNEKPRLTQPGALVTLAVVLKSEEKIIGDVSASCNDINRLQAWLDVSIMTAYREQGYGGEALRGLMRACFEGMGMHRVTACADSRNTAHRLMIEQAGMRGEGEFLKDRWVNGEWVNTVYYGLLREEFCEPPKEETE